MEDVQMQYKADQAFYNNKQLKNCVSMHHGNFKYYLIHITLKKAKKLIHF